MTRLCFFCNYCSSVCLRKLYPNSDSFPPPTIIMGDVAEIVIVGAGISGLATALGLHRLGHRSMVLESSESLRVTGFAFTTWTNAWKALDALGVAESLRLQHELIQGVLVSSSISGLPASEIIFEGAKGKWGRHEVRCVNRKLLIEALEKELPGGTIRYSSKVVSIEDSGPLKLVHLADGSILKTKVLIGCDGVNSVVAKWLGFKKPAFTGRSAIRGCVEFKEAHGLGTKFLQFVGEGVRFGFLPCDDKTMYWFFTWHHYTSDKELEENPEKMKQFVLSKLGKVPHQLKQVVESTQLDSIISSPLRFRHPWDLIWGNISKCGVCVAGDAFHPMTPDLGQGACSALEDGIVLARCLSEALSEKNSRRGTRGNANEEEEEEFERIDIALRKYAKERKWRGIELIATGYMVGYIQQSSGWLMNYLRDKLLTSFLAGLLLKRADFDCGKLSIS